MKTFGFVIKNENRFVHLTCNIILSAMVVVVFCLSIFSPVSIEAYNSTSSAIYSGNKNSNNVSLLINVYGGNEFLTKMIKTLQDNNVCATFFVGGCWVAKNTEAFLEIVNGGFEIGSHGYNHKDHVKISNNLARQEIKKTEDLVFSLSCKKMNLFAPPSGSVNANVTKLAEEMGYKTIMWTRDTIDWRDQDEDLIFSRAVDNTKGGDFILMHPTQATANCLDRIIKALKLKNLNLTTVTENLESI